jgi:hypothetical protein
VSASSNGAEHCPAEVGKEGDEQVIRFSREIVESWLVAFRHIRQLRQKIAETPSRVFFYPACRFDWNPLVLFSSLCDTFIYCDLSPRPEDFEEEIRSVCHLNGLALGVVKPINLSDLQWDQGAAKARSLLSSSQQAQYDQALQAWMARQGWARCVQLNLIHGAGARRVCLYYLCAEGYSAYVNLFADQGAAPKVICLKGAHNCDKNWTSFLRWEGPLGRAVVASGKPEILVVHHSPTPPTRRSDDWPWKTQRKIFDNWEAAAFAADDF